MLDAECRGDVTPAAGAIEDGKLSPPKARVEWIARPRLLAELASAVRSPVTLIAAPAGYGKTTLVSQWFSGPESGLAAWLTLDAGDNDPSRLWAHFATALERVGCWSGPPAAEFVATTSTALITRAVPRVIEALATGPDPVTIVLDDCQTVWSHECYDQLDRLIEYLPSNAHLVVIARADPPLRLSRLRVDGRLAEFRSKDLAFARGEVEALLALSDVELNDRGLDELMLRTEGWPAAVYLCALSLSGRDRPQEFVDGLSGTSRFIADYLTEEVLSRLPVELRSFIVDLSLFDRFSASLGDHVRESRSSARLIRELERTNLFLLPLDGAGEWFRFHHLFGSLARSSLEIESPERASRLHARAADWFAAHGHLDEAVAEALAAGDGGLAATLVQTNWLRYFDAGRSATVLGWLDRLDRSDAADDPATTVTAAWMAALTGDRPELNRRLSRLEHVDEPAGLPDGTRSTQSALALIRGLFGFEGPSRMLADARRAASLETDRSTPWYATAQAGLGHAWYVAGDLTRATDSLTAAAEAPAAATAIRVLALGTLALCQAERGRPEDGQTAAEAAMRLVDSSALRPSPQGVFAFTALGAARVATGHVDEGLTLFDEGLRTRRQVSGLSPWPMIHHLIAMSIAVAGAGQRVRAEQLLAEAQRLCGWSDDGMGAMRARLARARAIVHRRGSRSAALGEPLTRRELEVLNRLQGPESLRELGDQLYVSRNTVKTLTSTVYRKLGVHSREEAVRAARGYGLLETGDRTLPG